VQARDRPLRRPRRPLPAPRARRRRRPAPADPRRARARPQRDPAEALIRRHSGCHAVARRLRRRELAPAPPRPLPVRTRPTSRNGAVSTLPNLLTTPLRLRIAFLSACRFRGDLIPLCSRRRVTSRVALESAPAFASAWAPVGNGTEGAPSHATRQRAVSTAPLPLPRGCGARSTPTHRATSNPPRHMADTRSSPPAIQPWRRSRPSRGGRADHD
jgi:hypothetical protein